MKRCQHLNVIIEEEIAGVQLIEIANGQKIFDGDAGDTFSPTGRYFVRCKDCKFSKTYTLANRPNWVTNYMAQGKSKS